MATKVNPKTTGNVLLLLTGVGNIQITHFKILLQTLNQIKGAGCVKTVGLTVLTNVSGIAAHPYSSELPYELPYEPHWTGTEI